VPYCLRAVRHANAHADGDTYYHPHADLNANCNAKRYTYCDADSYCYGDTYGHAQWNTESDTYRDA